MKTLFKVLLILGFIAGMSDIDATGITNIIGAITCAVSLFVVFPAPKPQQPVKKADKQNNILLKRL